MRGNTSASQPTRVQYRLLKLAEILHISQLGWATHLHLSPLVMAEEGVGMFEVAELCPDLHWEVASQQEVDEEVSLQKL
ncbi:unnamed protein product [Camellia sinensis]